jgi:hypothetical protein
MNEVLQQERQRTYKLNMEERSRNHCTCGTAMCISYSECFSVALAIHCEMRKGRIILSSVACLTSFCFSTLSHKLDDFLKKSY